MLQAILEGVATFGPIVFLMLTPVLIPVITTALGAMSDRGKPATTHTPGVNPPHAGGGTGATGTPSGNS